MRKRINRPKRHQEASDVSDGGPGSEAGALRQGPIDKQTIMRN
jgi:hypothetical protein